ncbi:unnamed protein product, partial [Protopolystoma xenopodis]
LERNIIASDPRVTRFPIDWGDGLLDGCPEPAEVEGADYDLADAIHPVISPVDNSNRESSFEQMKTVEPRDNVPYFQMQENLNNVHVKSIINLSSDDLSRSNSIPSPLHQIQPT